MTPALDIKDLSKSFLNNKVLHNLNLSVSENEIVAISGKSGCGKTTLLLCLLGFINPDEGHIYLHGSDLLNSPIEQRAIAYMPQDYGLFPHLSVSGNILFGLDIRGADKETKKDKIKTLLEIVELNNEIVNRNINKISGGEKQRVALARALAINPKLILMDEPLSAIDIETKKEVSISLRKIIKRLNVPAIMITHDPSDAHAVSDTLYELENGQLSKIWHHA